MCGAQGLRRQAPPAVAGPSPRQGCRPLQGPQGGYGPERRNCLHAAGEADMDADHGRDRLQPNDAVADRETHEGG